MSDLSARAPAPDADTTSMSTPTGTAGGAKRYRKTLTHVDTDPLGEWFRLNNDKPPSNESINQVVNVSYVAASM